MLVVLWDEMVLDWSRAGLLAVNDVLAHYRERVFEKIAPPAWLGMLLQGCGNSVPL